MFRFVFLLAIASFLSCSKDSKDNNCKHLIDVGINATFNLSLPQYSQLQFISNSVYVAGYGNKGIIVINTGSAYRAWDASDPNHSPNSCSTLRIEGAEAVCSCDDANTYSLITGQPLNNTSLTCGLKEYSVEQNGNILIVSN